MRINLLRFDAATRAAACAAAVSLLLLAQGCTLSAPAGGESSAGVQSQAHLAQPSPAQTAQPTPAAQATPAGENPLPPPEGFVNDFAGVVDDTAEALLEARLRGLRRLANIEIAVVTVETTGGRDINEYSLAVARGWGVGPPDSEEGGGILLLLSVKDRRWRLQVSERLRGDLPDDVSAQIGERMIPALRAGDYGEAIDQCLDGLIKRLAERRGFKEDELILQALPEEKSKPSEKPKAGDRRKAAPRATP